MMITAQIPFIGDDDVPDKSFNILGNGDGTRCVGQPNILSNLLFFIHFIQWSLLIGIFFLRSEIEMAALTQGLS